MVDSNEGLLREVEEELRRERLTKLWNDYGNWIVTVVALFVASFAGWKYWQNQKITAAQTAGMNYESAMTTLGKDKLDDAAAAFKSLSDSGQDGYEALASLQLAGAYLKQGKKAEAKSAFEMVSGDTGADPLLRDFATIQSVALDIGEADLPQVQNRLNGFLTSSSPWRANARELVALSAFGAKDYDVAKENLRAIVADAGAPAGVLRRANTMLANIAAIEVAAKGGDQSTSSSSGAKGAEKKSDAAEDSKVTAAAGSGAKGATANKAPGATKDTAETANTGDK